MLIFEHARVRDGTVKGREDGVEQREVGGGGCGLQLGVRLEGAEHDGTGGDGGAQQLIAYMLRPLLHHAARDQRVEEAAALLCGVANPFIEGKLLPRGSLFARAEASEAKAHQQLKHQRQKGGPIAGNRADAKEGKK